MMAREFFPIGALSGMSRVNVETIRYYERIGLLAKPARTAGGYRAYRVEDADRLTFIRGARDLGFSLDEVRQLLGLADGQSRSCRRVHDLASVHLAEVRTKLTELRRMERVLGSLVRSCAEGTMPVCPLLQTLSRAGRR